VSERWVELEGNENVRDLGGLPTVAGGVTRPGVLLRSDTVQHLTAADVAWLRDSYGLRTILDLRAPKEVAVEGRGLLALEALDYYNVPFLPDVFLDPSDPTHDVIVRERRGRGQADAYLDYLRLTDGVATAIRLIASPGATPLLFHCAAGKDRTGVLSAFVLDLVGVERDAIVADYEATNERLWRIVARLSKQATYAASTPAPTGPPTSLPTGSNGRDIQARPETMRDLLAAIDEHWGGTQRWAADNGITPDHLARLRALLVG
jgi:protein-tyrosine phosphatase